MFRLEVLQDNNGCGHDIVMLHGAHHAAWCWDKFIMFFSRKGYNVYAPSYRGHGESEGKKLLNTFTLNDYANDVYSITKNLSRPAIIITHSLGAAVMHEYLRLYPYNVCSIIYISPVPVQNMLLETIKSGFANKGKRLEDLLFDGRVSSGELLKYKGLLEKEESVKVKWALLIGRPKPPQELNIPMLTIGSWQDRIVNPKDIIRHAEYFNSYLVMLKGLCHDMILEEQWDTVAQIVMDFINNVEVKADRYYQP